MFFLLITKNLILMLLMLQKSGQPPGLKSSIFHPWKWRVGRRSELLLGHLCTYFQVLLLMVQKSGDHHFGCIKPVVNNGIDYQAQLVGRISEPSTVSLANISPLWKNICHLAWLVQPTPFLSVPPQKQGRIPLVSLNKALLNPYFLRELC